MSYIFRRNYFVLSETDPLTKQNATSKIETKEV